MSFFIWGNENTFYFLPTEILLKSYFVEKTFKTMCHMLHFKPEQSIIFAQN